MILTSQIKPIHTKLLAELPGPDRKRTLTWYCYQKTYRNLRCHEPGCVATWSVTGGREEYQIALERTESGQLCWHCTCADSVFRVATQPNHLCKHIRGAMECLSLELDEKHQVNLAGETGTGS